MSIPPLRIFADDLHDEFGRWPLAYTSAGGPELAEVVSIASEVGDGDDRDFAWAFAVRGDALVASAEAAHVAGHQATAAAQFVRAAALFGAALHPLYGDPVDPLLLDIAARQERALDRGLALRQHPAIPLVIPCDGNELPGYLIPAEGHTAEPSRPVIIFVNGYDATMTDVYFASAVAATRRGYHAVIFDGPGQGSVLYRQGIPMRPDWEVVVSAVIDTVLQCSLVDPRRIAVSGWSLGGYLAPRAASGDSRIAACIADPGQWDLGRSVRGFALAMGATPQQAADLTQLDDAFLANMWEFIQQNRRLRWSVVQRGFWVNGVRDLREFLAVTQQFTLVDRAAQIQCPTLLTLAENDPLAESTQEFYEALRCPKTLLRFTAADSAADHCEMGNRSLLNTRVLDWLDDTFAAS